LTALRRCAWADAADPLMRRYHDEEWGVPHHDDRDLFELMTLEGAQAGLSWSTVLHRREGYRRAFEGWDLERIARLGSNDVDRLMADHDIIRNRAKIESTISNAGAALETISSERSIDALLWSFAPPSSGRAAASRGDVPADTDESRAMSRELKRRGFRFVGPTICYAFMQAAGLVDDHVSGCFRGKAGVIGTPPNPDS
jgi:DNA-3-methyladenine glycosylase I